MSSAPKKETIELSAEEIPELIRAVHENALSEKQKSVVLELIQRMMEIKQTARERAAALKKIRRMLEKKTEKVGRQEADAGAESAGKTKKNHGRNGADKYAFSKEIFCAHSLQVGQKCPECESGSLYHLDPGRVIRVKGQAPLSAHLYLPERLRCSGCGTVCTAPLPEDAGEEKTDETANALVAVFRYGMGIPNWRLARMQEVLGVPLPASTQWEMTEMLWGDVAPIANELLAQAADYSLFHTDDTGGRVLSLMKDRDERKAHGERVGVYTTGIVARNEGREVHLFFTGRHYAGENMAGLMEKRSQGLPEPRQMSDASTMNNPKGHAVILLLCLIHARREFIDGYEAFPDECGFVIEKIALIYKNDRITKEEGMDDQRRLLYHQQMSAPVMEEIEKYARGKLNNREVEPNSILGGAFRYLLDHYHGLTQFLRLPGAPLDNNIAERLLKKAVLHRKNSMFYKTENGARIGDGLMSVIHTAMAAKVNPVEYLAALQKHAKHVARNPKLWLPWNYKNTQKSVQPSDSG